MWKGKSNFCKIFKGGGNVSIDLRKLMSNVDKNIEKQM